MINLLPIKDKQNDPFSKYKHVAYLFTHLCLLGYVLFIAGTAALMLRGSSRLSQLNTDITKLETQLETFSKVEAQILHIDRTKNKIGKFKVDRANIADLATIINNKPSDVIIKNWDYRLKSNSRISVESQSQTDLEEYTKLLKLKYTGLKLEQTVTKGGVWNSILMLK